MLRTWTSSAIVDAPPGEVIDVLTDPAAAMRWSPFPFELDELEGERLEAGDVARVSGTLAGMRVGFDIVVHAADAEELWLTARGPVALDVRYRLGDAGDATEVQASVSVAAGRGLRGRALAHATDAVLAAGALGAALGRIAREAEESALVCR